MHDALWKMTQVDDYTLTVAVALVVIVFALIRTMVDSFTMAVVFTPVLMFGALAANYLFRVYYITPSIDKDTDVVIASAVGILAAMLLLLIAVWLSIIMSERRSRLSNPLAKFPIAPADSNPSKPTAQG